MTWTRSLQVAAAATVASALASALFWTSADPTDQTTNTARWAALPDDERRAVLHTYNSFASADAFRDALASLRQLQQYDPARREQLARLAQRVEQLIQQLPTRVRTQLEALPPAAQAVQLFHILEQSDPNSLDELARDFAQIK